MDEKDCTELKHPQTLVLHCGRNDQEGKKKVFTCMKALFLKPFKIFHRNLTVSSTLYSVDNQLTIAFDDGLQLFYERLQNSGWEERGGTVQTALFTYCRNQLRKLTKEIARDNRRKTGDDPVDVLEKKKEQTNDDPFAEGEEMRREREAIFRKAFLQLDGKCQDFIQWRKLQEVTDEEIRQKYPGIDWDGRDPDDIVYRCMMKLKRLVDEQKRNNGWS